MAGPAIFGGDAVGGGHHDPQPPGEAGQGRPGDDPGSGVVRPATNGRSIGRRVGGRVRRRPQQRVEDLGVGAGAGSACAVARARRSSAAEPDRSNRRGTTPVIGPSTPVIGLETLGEAARRARLSSSAAGQRGGQADVVEVAVDRAQRLDLGPHRAAASPGGRRSHREVAPAPSGRVDQHLPTGQPEPPGQVDADEGLVEAGGRTSRRRRARPDEPPRPRRGRTVRRPASTAGSTRPRRRPRPARTRPTRSRVNGWPVNAMPGGDGHGAGRSSTQGHRHTRAAPCSWSSAARAPSTTSSGRARPRPAGRRSARRGPRPGPRARASPCGGPGHVDRQVRARAPGRAPDVDTTTTCTGAPSTTIPARAPTVAATASRHVDLVVLAGGVDQHGDGRATGPALPGRLVAAAHRGTDVPTTRLAAGRRAPPAVERHDAAEGLVGRRRRRRRSARRAGGSRTGARWRSRRATPRCRRCRAAA